MPNRMPSAMGDRGYTQSPVSYADGPAALGRNASGTVGSSGPQRSPQYRQDSVDSFSRPLPRAAGDFDGRSMTPGGAPRGSRQTSMDGNFPNIGPSPPSAEFLRSPPPASPLGRGNNPNGAHGAYIPNLRSTSSAFPAPTSYQNAAPQPARPYRNMTDPVRGPPQGDYFANNQGQIMPPQRTATAQNQRLGPGGPKNGGGWDGEPQPPPQRFASPASFNGRGTPGMGPGPGPAGQGGMQQGGYQRW